MRKERFSIYDALHEKVKVAYAQEHDDEITEVFKRIAETWVKKLHLFRDDFYRPLLCLLCKLATQYTRQDTEWVISFLRKNKLSGEIQEDIRNGEPYYKPLLDACLFILGKEVRSNQIELEVTKDILFASDEMKESWNLSMLAMLSLIAEHNKWGC